MQARLEHWERLKSLFRLSFRLCLFPDDFVNYAHFLKLVGVDALCSSEGLAVEGELHGFVGVIFVSAQNRSGSFR